MTEGRQQVGATRLLQAQESPLVPSRPLPAGSSRRTGHFAARPRMLCTTSPGECVGSPDGVQVCLASSPDADVDGAGAAAGVSPATGPMAITGPTSRVGVRPCDFMLLKLGSASSVRVVFQIYA